MRRSIACVVLTFVTMMSQLGRRLALPCGTATRLALVAVALSVGVLCAACERTGEGGLSGNLLAGKSPHQSHGLSNGRVLVDGVAAFTGEEWDTNLSAQFARDDAFVTFDLGAPVVVRAIWLQADHNDDYRLLASEDGEVFEQAWDSPRVRGAGLQDRFSDQLDVSARYLRFEPVRGDGRYSVSELSVWSEVPAVFPPEVSRKRGVSLEVAVRTKVLMFAAAVIAFLFLTFAGASRWWIAACALLPLIALADALQAIALAWPVEQRQVSLVRAAMAAIAAAAVLREVFSPPRFPALKKAVYSALGVSGIVAVLAFYNLGQPQFWDSENQDWTPIHLLDLRQYYGTAKYFDELGYRGMYLADVAAYVEDIPGATLESLRDTPMRDLSTHRMSTIGEQKDKILTIKQRFTPERWEAYKRDSRYFREVMGNRDYLKYMFDFGGNATPVWISVAHFLFSLFEANSTAFLITALLDPLLFLVTFAAIGRCFGYRTMCVVMVVFGANDFIMYGSNWGGATLRHDWLMYMGLGACAFKRKHWALGGFFLALSTSIRAFPVITLVSATFPAIWSLIDDRRERGRWPSFTEWKERERPLLRALIAASVTAVGLLLVTSLRWSLPTWGDWLWKVGQLSSAPHGNSIALRGLIAGWQAGHAQLLSARWPLYLAAIALYVAAVFFTARKKPLERAAMLGLILVPVVFYAANYYIHIVCLLPLIAVERRDARPALGASDAWIWLILLGLCAAQYWTVLVTDLPLHFHLATVLLFAALTALLVVSLRADLLEGRLDLVRRWARGKDAPLPQGSASGG